MIKCCVNPACRVEFKHFMGGDLYALERRSAAIEFFWLCPACACLFEMYLDPVGYVSVRAGSLIHRVPPPHSDASLRLISHLMRPRPDTMPSGKRTSSSVSIVEPFSSDFRMRSGLSTELRERGLFLSGSPLPQAETIEGGNMESQLRMGCDRCTKLAEDLRSYQGRLRELNRDDPNNSRCLRYLLEAIVSVKGEIQMEQSIHDDRR